MQITIESNPNCSSNEQFVYHELSVPRAVRGIRVGADNAEHDVVGVYEGGEFGPARSIKIADSGNGVAHLIYGGEWGIRLRPRKNASEPWDLKNVKQWGESF